MLEAGHNSRRSVSFLVATLAASLTVTSGCKKDESGSPPTGPSPAPALTVAAAVTPTPATPPMLHAWANPITIGGMRFADHTWVTTYEAASHCPPPHTYWFSWGGCHDIGPGTQARALGAQLADVAVAQCICVPDVEDYRPLPNNPAHGGIDFYGISGVCHQLSNRILWATQSGGAAPLTVSDALGYGVSRFLFGTYGSDAAEWTARSLRCKTPGSASLAAGTPMAIMMAMQPVPPPTRSLDADLVAMLQERLGRDVSRAKVVAIQQLRANLLAAKAPLDARVRRGELPPAEFARQVNDLVNDYLNQAAAILSPAEYERLFGIPKGMKIGIVDPNVAERSNYRER